MSTTYSIDDLRYLMQRLRDPEDGCPWDQKQDFNSIAPFTVEEVYEVVDAIEAGNFAHLSEELGDLLFQVVFYSQMAEEQSLFDFEKVVTAIVSKLIVRHPHVFPEGHLQSRAGDTATDETRIKARWEEIKQQERNAKGMGGVLDDVPRALPALMRAQKLQKRAASVGFDWPDISGVVNKIEEELAECRQALASGERSAIEEELGDLMFSCVNLARHLGVDAEQCLRRGNDKFQQRFEIMEALADGAGLDAMSIEALEALWQKAKGTSD